MSEAQSYLKPFHYGHKSYYKWKTPETKVDLLFFSEVPLCVILLFVRGEVGYHAVTGQKPFVTFTWKASQGVRAGLASCTTGCVTRVTSGSPHVLGSFTQEYGHAEQTLSNTTSLMQLNQAHRHTRCSSAPNDGLSAVSQTTSTVKLGYTCHDSGLTQKLTDVLADISNTLVRLLYLSDLL